MFAEKANGMRKLSSPFELGTGLTCNDPLALASSAFTKMLDAYSGEREVRMRSLYLCPSAPIATATGLFLLCDEEKGQETLVDPL